MKKVTKFFIWGNIFDILSTIFGLSQGCIERNILVNKYGWITGGVVKTLSIIMVFYILESQEEHWAFWIGPIFLWLVVIWNMANGIMLMIQ